MFLIPHPFGARALAAALFLGLNLFTEPGLAKVPGQLPGGIEQITTVEGVTEYRLPNGLRVLLLPDDAKPLVTVNLVYLVGSRHEGPGESGMAHLLEHLVFKGTPTTRDPKAQFVARGMQWNGTTSFDRTNYFATFTPDNDNLSWYIGWLADSMVNSFIAQSDLDSEMTVVRNEFERAEVRTDRVLYQTMLGAAYQWHPYGRPVIGSRSDIENVSIERLQRFYRHYYQPDNAVLVVGGNFDPAAVLDMVAQAFGGIPRPARVLEPQWTTEPVQQGERRITVRRVGSVPLMAVSYHAAPAGSKAYAAQMVMRQILTRVPAGRLHSALVESGLAASIYDWTGQTADPGVIFLGVVLNEDSDVERVKQVLLQTLESFDEPSEAEVARAKTMILNAINRSLLDANGVAMGLTEYIASGDWRLRFALRDWIAEVTPADVAQQAKSYLVESNRTLGRFIPTEQPVRAPATPRPDLNALLQDYRGREAAGAIERFEPSNLAIEGHTIKRTLPGGMKLALLPRATRGERVSGTLRLHWGNLEDLTGRRQDAMFLAQMMLKGTTSMTRLELSNRLSDLDSSLTVGGGISGLSFNFNAPRENLDALIDLLADVVRNPVFPQSEFEQARRSFLAQNQSGRNDPSTLAWNALNRHLIRAREADPRSVLTLDQAQQLGLRANVENLARFYREFAGASHSELAIVGPVDVDHVQARLQAAFGDWKSPRDYTRIPRLPEATEPERFALMMPDKANAVYAAVQPIALEEQHADVPALFAAVQMLGGRAGARLWNRLREKEGLTYGIHAGLTVGMLEPGGRITISSTFAPQNRERFEAIVRDELEQVLRQGFTEAELADTKESILRSRRQALVGEGSVAGMLADNLYWGRTMEWREQRDQAYAALQLADVNAALRKYLDPARLSIAVAGDFPQEK
ncbi:MAG TPA: pitrilysin family protein [Noviherbaspirillum sp.]|nr:pitrilysin family protein [Noviherbaspirillum sp.]